jgi:hypothetical protein
MRYFLLKASLVFFYTYLFFKKPIDEKIKAWKEKHFPRKQAS